MPPVYQHEEADDRRACADMVEALLLSPHGRPLSVIAAFSRLMLDFPFLPSISGALIRGLPVSLFLF